MPLVQFHFFEISGGRQDAHVLMKEDGDDDWTGEDNGRFRDRAQESWIRRGRGPDRAVATEWGGTGVASAVLSRSALELFF